MESELLVAVFSLLFVIVALGALIHHFFHKTVPPMVKSVTREMTVVGGQLTRQLRIIGDSIQLQSSDIEDAVIRNSLMTFDLSKLVLLKEGYNIDYNTFIEVLKTLNAERISTDEEHTTDYYYLPDEDFPVICRVRKYERSNINIAYPVLFIPNKQCDDGCRIDIFKKITEAAALSYVKKEEDNATYLRHTYLSHSSNGIHTKTLSTEISSHLLDPDLQDSLQHNIQASVGGSVYTTKYSRIIDKVRVLVRKGLNTAVFGPSGTGKTTFAKVLAAKSDVPLVHLDAKLLENPGDVVPVLADIGKAVIFIDECQSLSELSLSNLLTTITSVLADVQLNNKPSFVFAFSTPKDKLPAYFAPLFGAHRTGLIINLKLLKEADALNAVSTFAKKYNKKFDPASVKSLFNGTQYATIASVTALVTEVEAYELLKESMASEKLGAL